MVGKSISLPLESRRFFQGGPRFLHQAVLETQEKTPPFEGDRSMRLSTKGRYAVMAMADLAGHAPESQRAIKAGGPGRYRRASGHFAFLSGTALRQAQARRAGHQRARPRRRLSPGAAVGRTADRRHHRGGGRTDRGHPLPAQRRPKAAPRPARAASPTICGKSWASRFMFSCPRFRWPMWWRSGCWAVRGPAMISKRRRRERGCGCGFRGGLNTHALLRSQRDSAFASRQPGRDRRMR